MKRTLIFAVLMALGLGGCSKSSPTEPTFTSSLSGFARLCGYEQGTLTVRDSAGHSQATTVATGTGNFAFGNVFVSGPYDVYLDKPGKPQKTVAMHGQDSSSPLMKVGPNEFYWANIFTCP